MQRKYYNLLLMALVALMVVSCQKEESTTILQNDCIKRSLGPNIVGSEIEFIYAAALPQIDGKLTSFEVEATIMGAPSTWMENNSYYTGDNGVDVGIKIGEPSSNSNNKTTVVFTKDTCAAALRYYYVIPEAARGKSVSFTFSAIASNKERVYYEMGPYLISNIDMELDMHVSNNDLCYLSIGDMKVYNAAEAAAKPDKIDLVYLYRNISGITFGHSLVSPGADAQYLPDITLPASVSKKSKLRKAWELQDRHLARIQYGIYIDDLDFEKLDMSNMPDFAINMKAESGLWIETEDKKYRAYIFINSVKAEGSAVISIKRYTMN